MKFLKPLHLPHEELQSSYSYLRLLELGWENQLNLETPQKPVSPRTDQSMEPML